MPPNRDTVRAVGAARHFFEGQAPERVAVEVPVETAVEIAFAGIPFAVMMTTPADLEAFAIGFCLTEGVIDAPGDVRSVAVEERETGLRLAIELSPDRMARHLARRRTISGRTGCGICGVEDLASLERPLPAVQRYGPVRLDAVERALSGLEARQSLFGRTHAVHGAAWATREGAVTHLFEDVGRHNALDKLVGALVRDRVDPASGFAVITSRCSFEMVDKAACFGAGLLVAMSAPTSLALARAERLGMAVLCIARRDGVTVFLGETAQASCLELVA